MIGTIGSPMERDSLVTRTRIWERWWVSGLRSDEREAHEEYALGASRFLTTGPLPLSPPSIASPFSCYSAPFMDP